MISPLRVILSILLASLIAYRGYAKRSLDKSGAITAFLTGAITFFCGYRFGTILILFFGSSSFLTKYRSTEKKKLEADFKEGGQRDWIQVLCNSFPATVASMAYFAIQEDEIALDFERFWFQSFHQAFILGFYACCNGDTWASELGILSPEKPYLITNLKRVAPGTNGGVSVIGTGASVAGGTFIGVCFYVLGIFFCTFDESSPYQWPLIFLGTLGGTLGSLIDSYLGATMQYSGWSPLLNKVVHKPGGPVRRICGEDILDNHQVNLISAVLTGFIIASASSLLLK
eukprot:TRINITY_DN10058_c0_g1_i1.p1 TRINITY_DN10058_c0_g1~~TRINITY_DN10058_c0_g1_i1.p1  ORF type:complete len:286 (+),score=67.58 TRINITY_DN10058_c0_g1_i1:44-901(+)